MEQHNQEIGTRRDLSLHRLKTLEMIMKTARTFIFILKIIKRTNSCIFWYVGG